MKDEARNALRKLVCGLERMDFDDLGQFRQEPGVKLLLEWIGHQRPSQTTSPDVMEVWRDAIIAWSAGGSREASNEVAATVIAEAKARWLAERDAEIARMREALEDAKQSLALAIYGLPEMLENNALSDEEGMVPALQAAVERMEAAIKEPRP